MLFFKIGTIYNLVNKLKRTRLTCRSDLITMTSSIIGYIGSVFFKGARRIRMCVFVFIKMSICVCTACVFLFFFRKKTGSS